jgi:(2Fe-2S) ferredoxin
VIGLKALALYTPDLRNKLYDFAIQNDAAPYLTAGTPARLHVTEPAVLDDILLCLKFIEAGGERLSPKVAGTCWDRVAKRDEAFYAASAAPADLAPDDARRPFFPRGGADHTPAAMAKFIDSARIYASSLPATIATPPSGAMSGEQADRSRLVQPLAGVNPTAGANYFVNFIKENNLQPEQLVTIGSSLYGDGDNIAILFVTPNRWSLYQLTVPKESLDRHPGTGAQSVSAIRLGAARLIRGDLGQNALAIDLTPVSLKASIGDDTLASRTFDDIPALNGAVFTSSAPPPTTQPPGSGPAPLDAAMVDLLAAKAVGDKLSQEALSYLVTRRWLYENGKGAISGGRFFALGKRQPTPEEALSLAPSFVDWARQHGPDLPARVTITAKVDVTNNQTTALWSTIRCLGKDLPGAISSDRVRDWARTEIGSPGRAEAQKVALEALHSAGEAFYVGGLSHPCGVASPSISFRDPAVFAIRIPHALPVPKITALGGKQQLDLTATLSVNSIALSQHPPALADMLPTTLAAMVPGFPGAKPAGEFIIFDTSFIEARWSDASGKDVARLGADQGESLDSLVKAFEQKRVKLLAAEATPEGPYGPDLVGLQLGMSFEDAERAVRNHMKVGRVLEGRRAFDEGEKSGAIKPLASGKLFISEGEDEVIAILDEPPAAKGRVLAAWRRVSIPAGNIDPTEIFAGIEKKYGKPGGSQAMQAGTIISWYPLTGSACAGLYASGRGDPIAEIWLEGGRQPAHTPAHLVQSKAPTMPDPLFDPLNERSQRSTHCGPFMTVQLLTGAMTRKPRDELDMTLTDIGPYLKAYSESRNKLSEGEGAAASAAAAPVFTGAYGPDMVGIKLGMTFPEAERIVREHMKVGRVLETGKSEQDVGLGKSAGTASSGKLFISEDQSELIAILDEPQGAGNTVVAAWRQIYAPPSATLEFASGRLKDKYGQPVFGSNNGDVLFWGTTTNRQRCTVAYTNVLQSRLPISARWTENGASTTWRPTNGDNNPTAPVITNQLPANAAGSPVEDCGPWLTMQFFPAQGYPPLNVIETTLTDRARYEKARQAGIRTKSPSAGSIKF